MNPSRLLAAVSVVAGFFSLQSMAADAPKTRPTAEGYRQDFGCASGGCAGEAQAGSQAPGLHQGYGVCAFFDSGGCQDF